MNRGATGWRPPAYDHVTVSHVVNVCPFRNFLFNPQDNSYKNFQTVHYFDSDIIGSTNFIERKNRSQFKRLLSLQDAYKTFSLMYLVSYKSFIAASVLFFPLFLLTSFGEPFNQTLSTLQLSRIHKCKLSTQLKLYEFYVIFSRNE